MFQIIGRRPVADTIPNELNNSPLIAGFVFKQNEHSATRDMMVEAFAQIETKGTGNFPTEHRESRLIFQSRYPGDCISLTGLILGSHEMS